MPEKELPTGTSRSADVAVALLIGAIAGVGMVGWDYSLGRLFGHSLDSRITLVLAATIAFAFGLRRDAWPGRASGDTPTILGNRFLLLGLGTGVLALAAEWGGSILGWVGASIDSAAPMTWLTRALAVGVVVLPAGFLAGSSLRRFTRDGSGGPGALAWVLLGAAWGVALAHGTELLGDSSRVAFWRSIVAAGGLMALGAAFRWRPRAETASVDEAPPAESAVAAAWFSGFGALTAVAGLTFLSGRVMLATVGNDLPSLSVGELVIHATLALGMTVGIVLGRVAGPGRAVGGTLIAVALSGSASIFLLGRYDMMPAAFHLIVAEAGTWDELVRGALSLAVPRVLPLGVLLGMALGLLARSVPHSRGSAIAWLERTGIGVLSGVALGVILPRLVLPAAGIPNTLAVLAVIAVIPATIAVVRSRLPGLVRLLLAITGPGLVAAAATRAPEVDRLALLVDRDLRSSTSSILGVQRSWLSFDRDDAKAGVAVMRRGHLRRAFVNGRFELAKQTTEKSHGILAHLPLALHASPRRTLVMGTGTGWAVASALAHPVDVLDVFETSTARLDAARAFGPGAQAALSNERTHVHVGDPEDLLARARPYDVIINHLSGRWTELSSRTSTHEFLSLVADRLSEDGLYTQWLPQNALTKEGFQILLATYAAVFPRVEIWAGLGGDVVLLGCRSTDRHDFGNVLAAYRRPVVARATEAAWIATPETLLSQYLLDDAGVRRIAGAFTPHRRSHPRLEREEIVRRLGSSGVDPVPGLAAIRADVVAGFANTPGPGFAEAIARATRVRDLERSALNLESEEKDFEAVAAYREAIELNPQDRAVRRALATLRTRMGIHFADLQEFTAAHSYLREACEVDTTYAPSFANLGRLLSQNEDYDYAISVLSRACMLAPDNDLFHLDLARVWKRRGYYDKSMPWYEKARKLNPLNVEAGTGWIDAKLAMAGDNADMQEGIDFLRTLLDIEPNNEIVQNRIGRLEEAIARGATESDPYGTGEREDD